MSRIQHVPRRMCMGCGERSPQADLVRVRVTPGGRLLLAGGGSHAGRSGYLHPLARCWELFASRKGSVRSLLRTVDKPVRFALVTELKQAVQCGLVR